MMAIPSTTQRNASRTCQSVNRAMMGLAAWTALSFRDVGAYLLRRFLAGVYGEFQSPAVRQQHLRFALRASPPSRNDHFHQGGEHNIASTIRTRHGMLKEFQFCGAMSHRFQVYAGKHTVYRAKQVHDADR